MLDRKLSIVPMDGAEEAAQQGRAAEKINRQIKNILATFFIIGTKDVIFVRCLDNPVILSDRKGVERSFVKAQNYIK